MEENRDSETMELQKYPRDLLNTFNSTPDNSETKPKTQEEGEEDTAELNLGLSLGGRRFGVDKSLTRSSSVVCTLPIVQESTNDNDENSNSRNYTSLIRDTSLPTEVEEDRMKRKEVQNSGRLGAKRSRCEKQASGEFVSCGEEKKDGDRQLGLNLNDGVQLGGVSGGSVPLPPWVVASRSVFLGCKVNAGSGVWQRVMPRGWSSGSPARLSVGQGSGSCGETRNHARNQSNQHRNYQNVPVPPGTRLNQGLENMSEEPNSAVHRGREIGLSALSRMPGVFTRGSGPDGKRVDGILYMYRKGEEPRIMCVCHGGFHTPKEFVRHAGGDEVDQPLKHIVVYGSSPSVFSQ